MPVSGHRVPPGSCTTARAGRGGHGQLARRPHISDTFGIFDTLGSEDARQPHINGEITAALPEILPADVLAAN